MKIRCIDNSIPNYFPNIKNYISIGTVYSVLENGRSEYRIICDNGETHSFYKDRFEVVSNNYSDIDYDDVKRALNAGLTIDQYKQLKGI